MPISRKQGDAIIGEGQDRVIPPNRIASYNQEVTESYTRRRLYAYEDATINNQFKTMTAAWRDIRSFASDTTDQFEIDDPRFAATVSRFINSAINASMAQLADDGAQRTQVAYATGLYGRLWGLDVISHSPVNIGAPVQFDMGVDETQAFLQSWREFFADEATLMSVRARRVLALGVTEDDSLTAMMTRVRASMGLTPTGFTNLFFPVQSYTRTAVIEAGNVASLQAYQQNTDHVGFVEWITSFDNRVCVRCQRRDGTQWRTDDPLFPDFIDHPPEHANCRCLLSSFLLLDAAELADKPPGQSWKEWLDSKGLTSLWDVLEGGLQSSQV